MRKFSLLMGALGGAMAGYLLSDDTLRKQLAGSKNAEEAAKTLGRHLQSDGSKFVKDVQDFVKSDDVQNNLKKAKKYAREKFQEAKTEARKMMKKEVKMAKTEAKKAGKMMKSGFKERGV